MIQTLQKHLLLTCWFIFFFLQTLTAQKSNQKTYAVVIGIAGYQNKALPQLNYPDKDATLFAAYLQSKAGGNVPQEQIRLLLNDKATIAAVYEAFDWLKETCKKNDRVYIYFSGHGDLETKDKLSVGYLLAYNTPPNNYVNNAISINSLNNTANTLTLKNGAKVIIITDACHAGKLAGDFFKGKQYAAEQLSKVLNNQVRLAACAASEEAAEGPDWGGGRGVFSYYLLNGLSGSAAGNNTDSIRLSDITKFLTVSFANDKYLVAGNHQQTPVIDGNETFALGAAGNAADTAALNNMLPESLRAFAALKVQPIDYFFDAASKLPLEGMISFANLQSLPVDSLPLAIINACIKYQLETDSMQIENKDAHGNNYIFSSLDSLVLLQQQLEKIKSLSNVFTERFVQMVQDKCQEMINAYLIGDIAELEKRQYYYANYRTYNDFLAMLQLALKLIPPGHELAHVLQVNNYYLTGLICRLNMATSTNTDSLLNEAFINQQKALALEPYAAYIHNELGNLFLHQKKYDSAEYHYKLDDVLAPTWSIPWSNKIRLYIAQNKIPEAIIAMQHADSLQPNLSYTLVNAGIAKEKAGNFLAAETMYYKAISLNDVHYLPFERLGNLYLETGDFASADTFFHKAYIRRQDFALNDSYFTFGIEMGQLPGFDSAFKEWQGCPFYVDSLKTESTQQAYVKFTAALEKVYIKGIDTNQIVQQLQAGFKLLPVASFAHHYMAKLLNSNSQAAISELQKSIETYKPEVIIREQLHKALYGNKKSSDTCLLAMLLMFHYDVLEDYYTLASIYEQQNQLDKAAQQYVIIASIENKRQQAQAVYKAYDNMPPVNDTLLKGVKYRNQLDILQAFAQPLVMGGSLKLARLYMQQKQYAKAEQVLLNQVAQNRAAGFARQSEIEKNMGNAGIDNTNNYWLKINRAFEGETYNFYKTVINVFPRDYSWQQKAGLFLYRRLAMAYVQMNANQYKAFTDTLDYSHYPWVMNVMSGIDSLEYRLPGTDERSVVELPVYNPLKEAFNWLQQSVKLSPDIQPAPEVAEALADMNSWMGNKDEAIQQYEALLQRQPLNVKLRNKLINYFTGTNNFYGAYMQLDTLYHQKSITKKQVFSLGEYNILNGKYKTGYTMVNAYHAINNTDAYTNTCLLARMYVMQNNFKQALYYYKDSLPVLHTDSYDEEVQNKIQQQNYLRLYAIARLYILLKDNDHAFSYLKQSLDGGFKCKYVFDMDTVWNTVRKNARWQELINNYDIANNYTPNTFEIPKIITDFWVPNMHYGY